MCLMEKDLHGASRSIDACVEDLADLMATFRMYGGRGLEINRGDFDIQFFKDLHAKCERIEKRLQDLGRTLSSPVPKRGDMVGHSKALRIRTFT